MLKFDKVKVLMFVRLYFPHIGGVEKHVQKISEILLNEGFKVTLVTEKFEENLADKEKINGVEVHRIELYKKHKWFNKFKIWLWLLNHLDLIKNADLVHCHDIFFWYLPFRFLFPKKPVYVTFHGWEGKFPIPKRYILVRKIWEKLAWGNICIGDYLKRWYGTKTEFVTYGGVNYTKKYSAKEEKTRNSLKIAFLGRLEKEKGFLNFIAFVKILNKKKIKLLIKFYGDGSFRKVAEEFGEVLGSRYITEELAFQNKFIYTSGYLSSLETMGLKRLILNVYKNSLEKDIFETSPFSGNILIEASPQSLANKVLYFLNHPGEEKKIVERGYEWARGETWEKVADLYLKLWGMGKNGDKREKGDKREGK